MADSRLTVKNIKFGISGMEDIYEAQKKLVNGAKANKKAAEDYLKQLEAIGKKGTQEYKDQEIVVKNLTKAFDQQSDALKKLKKDHNKVLEVIENISTAGQKDLKAALRAIEKGMDRLGSLSDKTSGKLKRELIDRQRALGVVKEQISTEYNARKKGVALLTEGLTKEMTAYNELSNIVSVYERQGRTLAASTDNQVKTFERMGEVATQAKVRMGNLDGSLKALAADADPTRIREYIKAWKEIQTYQGATDKQKAVAGKQVAKGEAALANSNASMLMNGTGTQAEMQAATKELQTYMANTKLAKDEVIRFNEAIARGAQNMKASNMDYYTKQMQNVKTLSKDALADNKKYWQALVDGGTKGTIAMQTYEAELAKVVAEETRRNELNIRTAGNKAMWAFNNGTIEKNTQSIKENIDAMQKLRVLAEKRGEVNLVKNIDAAVTKLNKDLVSCQENVKMAEQYMANSNAGTPFKGTVADLEKVRSGLNDMKKKLIEAGDAEGVQRLEKALINVDADIRSIGIDSKRMQEIINNPKGVYSIKELEAAYEKLKAQIGRAGISQDEFNKKAARMKAIKGQINDLTAQYKLQNSTLQTNKSLMASLGTNLKNIVLHYIGLQMVMMRIFAMLKNNVKLSDDMTNISKVTGMANSEVVKLTQSIYSIDTRTSTEELMKLAEQAGKLGIATRAGAEGVRSFVEVGNMITNTLGDIGGAEAITELLKVNDVINKDSVGVETDLKRIGSAILNVGNNSKATYQAVTEFTKRMGPVADATHLTMQQVMGLGGAFSSMGTEAASAATATQRVMLGMVNNVEGVAKVVNMNTEEMMKKINSRDTFSVFTEVLGRLDGDTKKMDAFFKVLGGRYNMQARSAITLLSQHLNELHYQVGLAEEGFKDGEMVTEAYNRANDNLAGVLDRISNEFQKMTTSVAMSNDEFASAARGLLKFVQWLRETRLIGSAIIGVLSGLVVWTAKATYENAKLAISAAAAGNSYKGFFGTIVGLIDILRLPFVMAYYKATGATDQLTAATNRWKAALAGNWLTLLITVVTAVAMAFFNASKKAQELADKAKQLHDQSKQEIDVLRRLKQQIEDVNTPQQRRNDLIADFNKKAGQYLTNLLTETNYAKQLSIAYNEAAQAIHKKNKEQALEEGNRAAQEASLSGRASADSSIRNSILTASRNAGVNGYKNDLKGLTQEQIDDLATNAEATIEEFFNDETIKATQKTAANAMAYLQKKMGKNFDYQATTANGLKEYNYLDPKSGSKNIYKSLMKYADAMAEGQKARQPYDMVAKVEEKGERRSLDAKMNDIYTTFFDVNGNEKDAKKYYTSSQRYKMINDYLKYKKNKEGDNAKNNARVKNMEKALNALTSSTEFPWGTPNTNPDEMNPEELSAILAYFNNIKNTTKNIKLTGNATYVKPVGVELPENVDSMSQESIRSWAWNQWSYWQKIQDEKNHSTNAGDFKPERDSSRNRKSEFDTSDAALAELDRYYSWLDEQEKERLAKREITQAEYERRQLKNETEHHQKKGELYEYFNDKTKDGIVKWWKSIKELDSVSWKDINDEQAKADEKHRKQNALNAQKNFTEVKTMYAKSIQEINKLLLENNPTAKVIQSLTDSLDSLGLLTGNMFKDADIVQQLRPIMNDISNLTEKQLVERLMKIPTLADILTGDDATVAAKLKAYILKLTEGSEEYTNALRKEAQKEKKRADFEYDSTASKAGMTDNLSTLQQNAEKAGNLESLGMGSDMTTANAKLKVAQQEYQLAVDKYAWELKSYDLELARLEAKQKELRIDEEKARAEGNTDQANELAQQRMQAELDYEDLKQKAMFATEEMRAQVVDKQKAMDAAEHEVINKKLSYMKEYMSGIEQFGTSMTEAAFGTKEDRQKAAQELLRSVLETTKKIMLAKLEELIFEKTINKQKVIANQNVNTQIQNQDTSQTMSQMSSTLAKTQFDVTAGGAGGAGKTVGQLGWWGIPLIAVISAVLSALMATVMAQFNKSSSKVSASAGKLTTGMLTYARGRYPGLVETYASGYQPDGSRYTVTSGHQMQVQGNDGRSYNAVVKPNLTTGEYNRPHLGIVGEKGAELIVDSPTYRNIQKNAPWILQGIYNMKRFGTAALNHQVANKAMRTLTAQQYPTHAAGNIDSKLGIRNEELGIDTGGASNEQLMATLTQLTAAITTLQSEGVKGHFNILGDGGLVDSYDKGKKFNTMVGK